MNTCNVITPREQWAALRYPPLGVLARVLAGHPINGDDWTNPVKRSALLKFLCRPRAQTNNITADELDEVIPELNARMFAIEQDSGAVVFRLPTAEELYAEGDAQDRDLEDGILDSPRAAYFKTSRRARLLLLWLRMMADRKRHPLSPKVAEIERENWEISAAQGGPETPEEGVRRLLRGL